MSTSEMHHRVGQIPDALDTAGLADTTVVVFSGEESVGLDGPWPPWQEW